MSEFSELREFWLGNEGLYDAFAKHVRDLIARGAKRAGIQCEVTSRAKSLDSLLKKVVRKHYADPIAQITDKAGVRVILLYQSDRAAAVSLIDEMFVVLSREDKQHGLGTAGLGYSGYHCDVSLRDADCAEENSSYQGLRCEVQIQTRAQNAWSEATHDIQYKADKDVADAIPEGIVRRLNRLSALSEIFDDELAQARDDILSVDGFKEAQILAELERPYYRLNDHEFDRQLSLEVIDAFMGMFGGNSAQCIGQLVIEFVDAHREKIERIYQTYQTYDDADYVFVNQPEGLLLFYLIERDRYALFDAWVEHFPAELLESLVAAWGCSLA